MWWVKGIGALMVLIEFGYSIPIDNGIIGNGDSSHEPEVPLNDQGEVICNLVQNPLDLIILIDGSSSVGDENFEKIKDFAINIIGGFPVGPDAAQIGIVQYSDDPETEFSVAEHKSYEDIVVAIKKVKYKEGATFTGKALDYVLETETKRLRPNANHIILVVTDGASQDDVRNPASAVISTGIDVFVFAITTDVNQQQLLDLVGNREERVYQVEGFRDLQIEIRNRIVMDVCRIIAREPQENHSGNGPTVSCSSDKMILNVETKNPFRGKIYVKGYFEDPACKQPADSDPTTKLSFTVPMDACGVRRLRQMKPPGMFYEAVIVVSFHHFLITKVDRAFRVRCFFMEAEKTLKSKVDVSAIPEEDVEEQSEMPDCSYTLRMGSPDGPLISFAEVGEKVFHVWHCLSQGNMIHSLLVHSCTVDDGQGKIVRVIDEGGCALDEHIIQDLTYEREFIRAYRETHAFKFADRVTLYFTCRISLCLKDQPACQRITPPQCGHPGTFPATSPTQSFQTPQTGFRPEPTEIYPGQPTVPYYPGNNWTGGRNYGVETGAPTEYPDYFTDSQERYGTKEQTTMPYRPDQLTTNKGNPYYPTETNSVSGIPITDIDINSETPTSVPNSGQGTTGFRPPGLTTVTHSNVDYGPPGWGTDYVQEGSHPTSQFGPEEPEYPSEIEKPYGGGNGGSPVPFQGAYGQNTPYGGGQSGSGYHGLSGTSQFSGSQEPQRPPGNRGFTESYRGPHLPVNGYGAGASQGGNAYGGGPPPSGYGGPGPAPSNRFPPLPTRAQKAPPDDPFGENSANYGDPYEISGYHQPALNPGPSPRPRPYPVVQGNTYARRRPGEPFGANPDLALLSTFAPNRKPGVYGRTKTTKSATANVDRGMTDGTVVGSFDSYTSVDVIDTEGPSFNRPDENAVDESFQNVLEETSSSQGVNGSGTFLTLPPNILEEYSKHMEQFAGTTNFATVGYPTYPPEAPFRYKNQRRYDASQLKSSWRKRQHKSSYIIPVDHASRRSKNRRKRPKHTDRLMYKKFQSKVKKSNYYRPPRKMAQISKDKYSNEQRENEICIHPIGGGILATFSIFMATFLSFYWTNQVLCTSKLTKSPMMLSGWNQHKARHNNF